MDGPERLEVQTGTLRRRGWLAIALVLVILGGLVGYRLAESAPPGSTSPAPTLSQSPNPMPPSPTSSSATPWPADLGQGTLFIRDDDGLTMVDLKTGAWRRSTVRAADPATTITAARGGVLVSHDDTRELPLLALGSSPQGHDVEASLRTGQRFLPGPFGSVWMSFLSTKADDRGAWQLVDAQGQVAARVKVSGRAISDGSGGLLDLTDDGVRHLVAGRPPAQTDGQVVAVGPDGYETQVCERRRCAGVLTAQPGDRTTQLERTTPLTGRIGDLSPGNRFVASVVSADDPDDRSTVVRVALLGSGRSLRTVPGKSGGSALTWVTERWLVATQDSGIVLYDAETNQLLTPALSLKHPDQVVAQSV